MGPNYDIEKAITPFKYILMANDQRRRDQKQEESNLTEQGGVKTIVEAF